MLQLDIQTAHPDYTPNGVDFDNSEVIMEMDGYHHSFTIRRGADDSAFLYWTDGMFNQWCEHYPTLALAFARFSILLQCAESSWRKFFADDPETFARKHWHFAHNSTTS